jgi:hypothetical protein
MALALPRDAPGDYTATGMVQRPQSSSRSSSTSSASTFSESTVTLALAVLAGLGLVAAWTGVL